MIPPFSYTDLAAKIKDIFINQEKYKFFKHVEEFKEGSKFLGDYFIFVIFESRGDQPPTFYTVCSPYDMVTKKAPEQAMVFENGKIILNIDFTQQTIMRTGIMDSLIVKSLGNMSLENKKVLYLGTGNIAEESLKALKEFFPELSKVWFLNTSKLAGKFGKVAGELGIEAQYDDLENIGEYDFIFCHTSAQEPVLTEEYLSKIKQAALITSFISSTEKGEVDEAFYDTEIANVIMDYDLTPVVAKELKAAMDANKADKGKIILLKHLFENKFSLNPNAKYTIYRSAGTPMQNVAVLKLLLNR
ncbi:MAG TPA: hypothetical protein VM077_00080 [Candidatus Limnocylindrales bacterium]|nr:hypothetical protein [Candidatus Limnocylindrales bacterium]